MLRKLLRVLGIVLAAALFAGARPLCVALRGTGETLDQAVAYTQAVVLGAPGMLLVYAANGIGDIVTDGGIGWNRSPGGITAGHAGKR